MGAVPPRLGDCRHCGGTNPPQATVCQYCGSALAITGPAPEPLPAVQPDSFQLVTTSDETPSAGGLVLLIFGIVLVLAGISLLVGAAVVHQQVVSWNNACAQNPLCHPESDPSGSMTAGGAAALILGFILAPVGYALRTR